MDPNFFCAPRWRTCILVTPVLNSNIYIRIWRSIMNLKLFRHARLRYPEHSRQAFGEKGGCFEAPSEEKEPSKNISCPDILPLMYSENKMNRDAMLSADPLVHPDTSSLTRYCLGTGLQMREGRQSHRSVQCSYHDANNSVKISCYD